MFTLPFIRLSLFLTVIVPGSVLADPGSPYNMSLQDQVVTGPNGSLTSPQAALVDQRSQIAEKSVRKIADGIYRIGGWGIGNIIAVEGPK